MSSEKVKTVTFENCEFHIKDEVIQLFPLYMQEQIKNDRVKGISNTVDIEPFTLQTPYKDKTLLKSTHLFLEPNKRHCLFGGNGTGKTLLFERMADYSIPGFPKHLNVHHCKEMEHVDDSVAESVIDTVVHSHAFLMTLRKVNKHMEKLMAENTDSAKTQGFSDVKLMVEQYLRSLNSDTAEENASKMLRALGFDEEGQQRSTNDLSGGLRMRVALCIAFFAQADLLLLDEPTNHLDFPSVLWLENRLRGYGKSFLVVTHDRDLLVAVTTSVLLLEDLEIHYYKCGFGEFEKQKAKEDEKKAAEVEKFIKFNRNADPSTPTGRMVADKKAWSQNYYERQVRMQGKFTFPAPTPLEVKEGENPDEVVLLGVKDVTFSYKPEVPNPNFIFADPITFLVTPKSRVGIMGPNGAGKSTLLKLLTGKIKPTTGERIEHPSFTLAYFGQHSTAELNMQETPLEFMCSQFPEERSGLLRNHLAKTSITNGVESTRMMNLSYSQRSCVIFAKLTYKCPHLLIMDEPTNFLDIESVDSLINAANKFPGALLVVTHSRHFLRKCAKSFLSVVPGRFLMFDDMKEAERSTYTFIQELESGVKVDSSALAAGGGTRHDPSKAAAAAAPKAGSPGAIDCPEAKFAPGEKVMSLWTDKKFYEATIVKIACAKPIKYSVSYPAFNKVATIPEAGIKKLGAQAPSAADKAAANEAKTAEAKAAREAEAKAAANVSWKVGDKCLAMRNDGKLYAANIVKVNAFDMYVVNYTDFAAEGDVVLAAKKLRVFDAAQAASAGGRGGGGRGGGGRGGGGRGKK